MQTGYVTVMVKHLLTVLPLINKFVPYAHLKVALPVWPFLGSSKGELQS